MLYLIFLNGKNIDLTPYRLRKQRREQYLLNLK